MTGSRRRTRVHRAFDHHIPLTRRWEVWWLIADIAGLLGSIALTLLAK
ncbi:hypothetical protein [Streptomyces sp. NPDC127033]